MKGTVPVYVELLTRPVGDGNGTEKVMCGTCAECGKERACVLSTNRDDGTPAERRAFAKSSVLADLTAVCDRRLPLGDPPGIPPAHIDRCVPRGVSVAQVDPLMGRELAVTVQEVGKAVTKAQALSIITGGVGFAATVLVIPEGDKFLNAAIEFATKLKKMGFRKAQTDSRNLTPAPTVLATVSA